MPDASPAAPAAEPKRARAGKYLTFVLAGEEYGIEILAVHEIIGVLPVTRVPRTPHFIRGVINLRGKVIPVIDLRTRFGMPAAEQTPETCMIVVELRTVRVALVVDCVSDVVDIAEGDVEDAPLFGSDLDTDYLLGIAKSNGRVKLLLDIRHVLTQNEMRALGGTAPVSAAVPTVPTA
jgi:purine-binding chemotaxis protein CheW